MKFHSHACRFLAFCALAALSLQAHADTGELLVTVSSEENRPLAGSAVTIESRTGERREAVADAEGRAAISASKVTPIEMCTSNSQSISKVVIM